MLQGSPKKQEVNKYLNTMSLFQNHALASVAVPVSRYTNTVRGFPVSRVFYADRLL